MMRRCLIGLGFFLIGFSLLAQNLESYHYWREKGISSYEAGQFEQAINELKLARVMNDRPVDHDLEQWIDKAYNGYVDQLTFARNRADSLLVLLNKRALTAETIARISELQYWDRGKSVLALSILRENLRLLKRNSVEPPRELIQLIFSKIVGQLPGPEQAYVYPLPQATLVHSSPVSTAVFSKDKDRLLTLTKDDIVTCWSAKGEILFEVEAKEAVQYCRFSADGKKILILTDSSAQCLDASGKQLGQIPRPEAADTYWSAGFIPEGSESIFTWGGNAVDHWSLAGKPLMHFEAESDIQRIIVQSEKQEIFVLTPGKAYLLDFQGEILASTPLPTHDRYGVITDGENWFISQDSIVYRWNATSPLQTLFSDTDLRVMFLSPGSNNLIIGTGDRLIDYDIDQNRLKRRHSTANRIGRKTDVVQLPIIDFSQDGQRLLTRWSHDTLAVLRDYALKPLVAISHEGAVLSISGFSSDSKQFITVSEDGKWKKWSHDGILQASGNTASGGGYWYSPVSNNFITVAQPRTSMPGIIQSRDRQDSLQSQWAYWGDVKELHFVSDSVRLLTQQDDKMLAMLEERPALVSSFPIPPLDPSNKLHAYNQALYSPDGKHLLTQAVEGLYLWDRQGNRIAQLNEESLNISFSAGGLRFLSQEYHAESLMHPVIPNKESRDWRIKLRNSNGTLLKDLGSGGGLSFSPDGTYIFDRTGSHIWNTQGELIHDFELKSLMWHDIQPSTAAISPTDAHILLLRNRFEAEIRSLTAGEKELTIDQSIFQDIPGSKSALQFVIPQNAFVPDGQSFILRVERLGLLHIDMDGNKLGFLQCDFSDDFQVAENGRSLILTSRDSLIEWNLETHKLTRSLRFPGTLIPLEAEALSQRAIVSRNGLLFLYDLKGTQIAWLANSSNFTRHKDRFTWSPTTQYLLYRASPTEMVLFSREGKKLISYDHQEVITSATFSPDGKYILTATETGQAREWPVPQTIFDWLESASCPIPELTETQKATYGLDP